MEKLREIKGVNTESIEIMIVDIIMRFIDGLIKSGEIAMTSEVAKENDIYKKLLDLKNEINDLFSKKRYIELVEVTKRFFEAMFQKQSKIKPIIIAFGGCIPFWCTFAGEPIEVKLRDSIYWEVNSQKGLYFQILSKDDKEPKDIDQGVYGCFGVCINGKTYTVCVTRAETKIGDTVTAEWRIQPTGAGKKRGKLARFLGVMNIYEPPHLNPGEVFKESIIVKVMGERDRIRTWQLVETCTFTINLTIERIGSKDGDFYFIDKKEIIPEIGQPQFLPLRTGLECGCVIDKEWFEGSKISAAINAPKYVPNLDIIIRRFIIMDANVSDTDIVLVKCLGGGMCPTPSQLPFPEMDGIHTISFWKGDAFYRIIEVGKDIAFSGIIPGEIKFGIDKVDDSGLQYDDKEKKDIKAKTVAVEVELDFGDFGPLLQIDEGIICVANDDDDDDDDNENGVFDRSENPVPKEDDLIKLDISVLPEELKSGTVRLEVEYFNNAKIKFWDTPDKRNEITNLRWDVTELPITLYVEGTYLSTEKDDIYIKAIYENDGAKIYSLRKMTVVAFDVRNPIDSDGNGRIDDDANASNNFIGNEFTFSTTTPAVLNIPYKVRILPDTISVRWLLRNKVRFYAYSIPAVQREWNNQFPDDITAGLGVYNEDTNLWEAEVIFTNLPRFNSEFGEKEATFQIYIGGTRKVISEREVKYEIFWPLLINPGASDGWIDANFAKNHPGTDLSASLSDTANGQPASTRAPNWFYYWRQVLGDTANNALYDSTIGLPYAGRTPAGTWFNRSPPKGPYVGPHNRILIGYGASTVDSPFVLPTTGIDCFRDTIIHENFHAINQLVNYTNEAFGLNITGDTLVANNHWSADIAKPITTPTVAELNAAMAVGRVYNHYRDTNGDGDFLDSTDLNGDGDTNDLVNGIPENEDLDIDGDDIPNWHEPLAGVEVQPSDAEPNAQDALREYDWGNPGKQHGPDGGSTYGEINRYDN